MSGKSPTPTDPDNVSEDDLPDRWWEKKQDALKDVLEEMTVVYNEDDEPIEVQFAEQSHADADGGYVAVNPTFWRDVDPVVEGPNVLRLLDELNSHEVGHYNWSDLDGKEEFGDMYPGWGKIPGHIANILEDEYVDAKKMREFYGLRSKRAYRVKLQLETDQFTPDVSEVYEEHGLPNALLTGLHQTALCGAVRGAEDVPDEVVEFCTLCEPIVERIRRQDDRHERFKLFHVVMQLFQRYVDDPEEFDDDEFEEGAGKTVSGEPDGAPSEDEVDPDDAMPDSFEEMIEDMMEELAEDEDMPIRTEPMGEDEAESGHEPSGIDLDSGDIEVEVSLDETESGETGEGGEELEVESEIDEDADDTLSGFEADFDSPESEIDDEASETDATGGDETDEDVDTESDGTADPDRLEDVDKPEEKPDVPEEFSGADIDGGEALHHVDPDDKEAFEEKDPFDTVEERYDVNLDEVEKIDDRDRAKWASLIKQLQEYDLDIEERKRERDERIEARRAGHYSSEPPSEELKQRAERSGVIQELEDGFRELVSRPLPRPSRRGTRIDNMNVARRAAGDMTVTELFEEETITETGERCVGLATDISGSMGSAIDELKIAGAAIAKATEIVGDEFVWEAFTDKSRCSHDCDCYPDCRLDLRIVTGPHEEFDWEHVDSFGAAYNEPTAAGVRDCFNLMQQTSANEYVMIVITDGVALITEDGRDERGTNEPVEHARQAVNEVRAQGVDVIGIGIGSMDDQKMEETFGGNNYRLTSIDRLADDILDLYKDQMEVVHQR